MSKRSGFSVSSAMLLQLCLGVFFLMLGIMGLSDYNSKLGEFARFFGRDDSLRLVMAVTELVMGGILIIGLAITVSGGIATVFSFALFALWALYMFMRNIVMRMLASDNLLCAIVSKPAVLGVTDWKIAARILAAGLRCLMAWFHSRKRKRSAPTTISAEVMPIATRLCDESLFFFPRIHLPTSLITMNPMPPNTIRPEMVRHTKGSAT